MYDNIDTGRAIKVISWWLAELAPELPDDFPIDAINFAMQVIMTARILIYNSLVPRGTGNGSRQNGSRQNQLPPDRFPPKLPGNLRTS